MAGRFGRDAGGIASLLTILHTPEQREALEFDLITQGLRLSWLGSEWLSWRDLLVIVRQSATSTALKRAMFGDEVAWSVSEHLLAQLVDNTNWLVWSKTEDAAKNRNRPARIIRPGDEPDEENEQHHGGEPLSLEQMQDWLGWQAPTVAQTPDDAEAT